MRAADGRPIEGDELGALFAPLGGPGRLALAVSGGPDSLALLVLAHRWTRLDETAPALLALTVDHGLRPTSAAEARRVAEFAATLGVECRILAWTGPHPEADIEAAAREARYALLTAAAREAGADRLATAHHQGDQAETFMLRLARGSGVYGLAAMRRESERGGLRLVRPLLGVPRARLLASLAGVPLPPGLPVDDPHNADPRFARARMRALMPRLAEEGLDPPRLAGTAERLGRAADALEHYADRLIAEAVKVDFAGAVRLSAGPFLAAPEEIRLRVLARILRAAGGGSEVPRLERLERLEEAMRAPGGARFVRTLAGTVVDRKGGLFRFQREIGREGPPALLVSDGYQGLWDGRFAVRLTIGDKGPVELGPLGEADRRALAVCVSDGLKKAIEALPAFRREGRLLAIPGLHYAPAAEGVFEAVAMPVVEERLSERARIDRR